MGKPVRMADIAEKLGISVVSVSKALAGKSGVSEEMRAKVVALARQMGYEGGRTSVEAGGSGNIGVLVADRFFADNTFYTQLYRALVMHSSEENLVCLMEIVTQEAEENAILPSLVTGRKVEGIIFMGNLAPDYLRAVEDTGLPCLLMDFNIPGKAQDCVVSDNLDGGFILTSHLLNTGRQEIGFVGSICATSSIMERYLGYQRALREAGIEPREDWLLEDRDEKGCFIPLKLPSRLPQAFVCNCDEVAYNLVEALRQSGARVPEDVAVCGYDDFRYATLCQPPLTTYRVDVELMAKTAMARLAAKLRKETGSAIRFSVPGRLVVRESSGASEP